jgi:hypothetical protein
MKQKILIFAVTLLTWQANAYSASSDQREQIIGKWDVRTYGHEFLKDGTCRIFDPEDGKTFTTGKWQLQGGILSLFWPGEPELKVRVHFLTPDSFEWESTPGRMIEVTRIGAITAVPDKAPQKPKAEDVKNCEFYTKAILKNSDRNENTLSSCYTPEFCRLIKLGIASTDEDPLPYLNYDFIYETQDSNPQILKTGPGVIKGEQIFVPVVMQHPRNKPFTKQFVYSRINDRWLVSDILTSGHEFSDGSLASQLAKQFQKQ